jgi:hypothetical protein
MVTLEEQKDFILSLPKSKVRDAVLSLIQYEIEHRCNARASSVVFRVPVKNYAKHIKKLYDESIRSN